MVLDDAAPSLSCLTHLTSLTICSNGGQPMCVSESAAFDLQHLLTLAEFDIGGLQIDDEETLLQLAVCAHSLSRLRFQMSASASLLLLEEMRQSDLLLFEVQVSTLLFGGGRTRVAQQPDVVCD